MNTTPTQHEAERLADMLEAIDGQHWQVQDSAAEHLRRIPALEAENASLMRLLVDLRFALGDDGKRMQDELIEFAKDMRSRLAELEAQRVALSDEQKTSLREAAQNALITLDGIASTNPRDKADFETPVEWIAWAKSRSRWAADILRGPIAQEIYAERILKKMLDDDSHGIGTKEGGQ